MTTFDYFVLLLTAYTTIIIMTLAYGKTTSNKLRMNYKSIILVLIGGLIITYNAYFTVTLLKIVMVLLVLIIVAYFSYKETLSKTIINTLVCYLIMMFYEVIISIFVSFINIIDINSFNSSVIFKLLFSIIDVSLVYISMNSKRILKLLQKINNKIRDNKIFFIMFSLIVAILVSLDFKYSVTFSNKIYLTNIIVIIFLFILITTSLYNYVKATNEMEKSEILLDFMSKYEKIVDDDRINRHEMLNNLLFLKSIKDKNSIEFNETLDDLIKTYDKKGIGIKNIYKLPSGLKGIFYYKLYGLQKDGYNININISKQISNSLKKIDHKDYVIIYKMVGILLDNAIEAAGNTKDKIINVDIFKEENNIVINIDNTFKGKIDKDRINEKNYSTKGKNRGLGLFIIRNLISNSNTINLEQSILNNIFTSKIIINKKKN